MTRAATRWMWVSLVALTCLGGCKRDNPLYCCTIAEACGDLGMGTCDDPDRPFCDNFGEFGPGRTCIAPPGEPCDGNEDCTGELTLCVDSVCSECETSADCSADRPVCDEAGRTCGSCQSAADCTGYAERTTCDVESGACVGCIGSDECPEATAPICDDDARVCRGCIDGSECASALCDTAGGACVAAADILYVDATGTGTECTQAEPCPTIQQAIDLASGSRHWIAVAPATYSEHLTIDDTTVRIVGPGATIAAMSSGPPVISIGDGADAYLRAVTIRNGGTANGHGVLCSTVANAPVLILDQVHIADNAGRAVQTTGCTLTIDSSTIHGNTGGGLAINGGVFTVRNSMLTQNGGLASLVGGADLTGPSGSTFEHNTVVGNGADDGVVAGVQCTVSGGANAVNNIIYGNGDDNDPQVSGNCTHSYSLIGPESMAGEGNLSDAPSFIDVDDDDYHLAPGSVGIDAAVASDIVTDFDGDTRPLGEGPDIGADEVSP